jgi:hypothetical protein
VADGSFSAAPGPAYFLEEFVFAAPSIAACDQGWKIDEDYWARRPSSDRYCGKHARRANQHPTNANVPLKPTEHPIVPTIVVGLGGISGPRDYARLV